MIKSKRIISILVIDFFSIIALHAMEPLPSMKTSPFVERYNPAKEKSTGRLNRQVPSRGFGNAMVGTPIAEMYRINAEKFNTAMARDNANIEKSKLLDVDAIEHAQQSSLVPTSVVANGNRPVSSAVSPQTILNQHQPSQSLTGSIPVNNNAAAAPTPQSSLATVLIPDASGLGGKPMDPKVQSIVDELNPRETAIAKNAVNRFQKNAALKKQQRGLLSSNQTQQQNQPSSVKPLETTSPTNELTLPDSSQNSNASASSQPLVFKVGTEIANRFGNAVSALAGKPVVEPAIVPSSSSGASSFQSAAPEVNQAMPQEQAATPQPVQRPEITPASILEAVVPDSAAIIKMRAEDPQIEAIKRFESALETQGLFKQENTNVLDAVINKVNVWRGTTPEAKALKLAEMRNVDKIVKAYEQSPVDSVFDPIVKLQQDINVLGEIGLNSTFSPQVRNNASKLESMGMVAKEYMIDQLAQELYPSRMQESVDVTIKALENKIIDIPSKISADKSNQDIYKMYETAYKDVIEKLKNIENAALRLETDFVQENIFSPEFTNRMQDAIGKDSQLSSAARSILQKEQFKSPLKEVAAQLKIDAQIQEKAVLYVDKKVQDIMKTLPSKNSNNLNLDAYYAQSIKQVVTELLKEPLDKILRTILIQNIQNPKEWNETNVNEVIKLLNAEFKKREAKLGSFSFMDVINATKDLEAYIKVLNEFASDMKARSSRKDSAAKEATYIQEYVDEVLSPEKGNDSVESINILLNGDSTNQSKKNSITATLKRLERMADQDKAAPESDIKKFNDVMNPNESSEIPLLKLSEVTVKDLVRYYKKIVEKLEARQRDFIKEDSNSDVVKQESAIVWEKYATYSAENPLRDSIVEVLQKLIDSKNMKNSKNMIENIREIIKEVKDIGDAEPLSNEFAVVKEKVNKLFESITSNNAPGKRSSRDNEIVVCSDVIDSLIKKNKDRQQHKDALNNKLNKLKKEVVVVGSSLGWGKNEINRSRINELEANLNKALDDNNLPLTAKQLKDLMDDFNSNLDDQYKISDKEIKTQEDYVSLLHELAKQEGTEIGNNSVYKFLKGIGDAITPLFYKSKPTPSSAAATGSKVQQDKAALLKIQQSIYNGKTEEAQNTALRSFVRFILNMNYMAGVITASLGGSGATIALILQYHANLNAQIQSNNNLRQDQKKRLLDESNNTLTLDILNAIVADKTGADIKTVQSGSVQDIAQSAAFNQVLNLLDPTLSYKYDPLSGSNPLLNSQQLSNSYNAMVNAQQNQQQNYRYPAITNGSSGTTYGNSGTTFPSYNQIMNGSNSTGYNPYTSSPYKSGTQAPLTLPYASSSSYKAPSQVPLALPAA